MYPFRPGMDMERLQLIWDIYSWTGSQESGQYIAGGTYGKPFTQHNKNRETTIAWDLAQMFGAIAGGYVIQLSPHYKGVQCIRKNKGLWKRVEPYVKIKIGSGCLPYDPGQTGERWEDMNDIHFFDPST